MASRISSSLRSATALGSHQISRASHHVASREANASAHSTSSHSIAGHTCCRHRLLHTSATRSVDRAVFFKKQTTKKLKDNLFNSFLEREKVRPDPILGYAKGDEARWTNSKLYQLIVSPEEVWAAAARRSQEAAEQAKTSTADDSEGKDADILSKESKESDNEIKHMAIAQQTVDVPERLNFDISPKAARLLFEHMPQVSAEYKSNKDAELNSAYIASSSEMPAYLTVFEQYAHELPKAQTLARIVDLGNASAEQIDKYVKQLIIREFGKPIPGRASSGVGIPEVQAALLTHKLHKIADHLKRGHRHDTRTRVAMIHTATARLKVLKYLKSKSVERYFTLLPQLGLDPRAASGEQDFRRRRIGPPKFAMGATPKSIARATPLIGDLTLVTP